jgi:hypothetical protein
MANIITNKLTVRKGAKKIFSSLVSEVANHTVVSDELYDILKSFSFQKIIKCDPDDRQEAFDKWGCPSDAQTDLDEFLSEDGAIDLVSSYGEFLTEWHPPVEIVRALQKKFPDYTFALDFIDEGFCFCGSIDINGEENFSEEEKDMRYYGAYLLNLSHKQLDEFLEVDEEDGKVKNDIDKFIEKNS